MLNGLECLIALMLDGLVRVAYHLVGGELGLVYDLVSFGFGSDLCVCNQACRLLVCTG